MQKKIISSLLVITASFASGQHIKVDKKKDSIAKANMSSIISKNALNNSSLQSSNLINKNTQQLRANDFNFNRSSDGVFLDKNGNTSANPVINTNRIVPGNMSMDVTKIFQSNGGK